MKPIKICIAIALLFIVVQRSYTQDFVNLNFESANVSGYSPVNYIPINAALPSWAAYYGYSNNPTYSGAPVLYDGRSLGGALIILEDTNAPNYFGPLPIQGNYSVLLEGSIPFSGTSASIGQTGTIPVTAQSLTFYLGNTFGVLQVTFNGQPLSIMDISNTLNYTIWGADISAYAGQTGQLLFTAPVNTSALLDNIEFSTLPVPEPSELAVVTLGALLLGYRRWRI